MTRAATWSNSDGLTVGFGRNFPERQAGGVAKTFGTLKEARLQVSYLSTFGASGAKISLPANSMVHKVWFESTTDWTSSDSGTLSVGDTDGTDDVDGWITATELTATNMAAGSVHKADGVYAVGDDGGAADTDNQAVPQVRATACDIYFTKANNFTAGTGVLVVQYS